MQREDAIPAAIGHHTSFAANLLPTRGRTWPAAPGAWETNSSSIWSDKTAAREAGVGRCMRKGDSEKLAGRRPREKPHVEQTLPVNQTPFRCVTPTGTQTHTDT